jgi:catechol 2,3-dioxygenase-like lactoylglutathione lyase family enzyme
MLQKLSHASIYVLDQDSAYDFYVNKLGFEVRTDARMDGGFRWLTVGPKGQPDMELILMPTVPSPMLPEEQSTRLREMVRAGAFGVGVFETDDCRATYEELKARGVEFMGEPEERFYGIEAIVKDDSGNWFSMTQRKEH